MPTNSLRTVAEDAHYIIETNVDIPLSGDGGPGLARCNVYRPKRTEEGARFPVLVTMGPYGKDIPYADFRPSSFADIPAEQKSKYSCWEVPDPFYWTKNDYILVRVDERGMGQSPGFMDTMSQSTAADFACCVEWAAEQPWSTGKVGLLGVSYFAGSQWRVAARQPKGLTCMIPWEGMSDYYRDRCRHGGIYSNGFIEYWWNRQVGNNQYGLAGRKARKWGPDTLEGDLSPEVLHKNRRDQTVDNAENYFLDDQYYASKDYDKSRIVVPLLSVANWGGILLHLRGNVCGYLEAGSENKWLYFITGRHDLPFYLPEFVALQKSFLDAWLHGKDDKGWLNGPNADIPAVRYALRQGAPQHNTVEGDRSFPFKDASAWPLPGTRDTKYFLSRQKTLDVKAKPDQGELSYQGLNGDFIKFSTTPFEEATQFTGHPLLCITMGIRANEGQAPPTDMDIFVTLRHIGPDGKEIFYTGTAGDPVPLCKGFLRASLRAIDEANPLHKSYLPYRKYTSDTVQELKADTPYELLVEIWPTCVLVAPGGRLVLEVAPCDTQGSGNFVHNHPVDRSASKLAGQNMIYFGEQYQNWLSLPMIPSKSG